MTYADPARRPDLIRGLRELAALLESRPDIPAPYMLDVLVFPPYGTDTEICAEVDRIATLLEVAVQDDIARQAHYTATRSFGPVHYRAVAIPSHVRAYHNARNSSATTNGMPGLNEEADR